MNLAKRITKLSEHVTPIDVRDTMAEAGRKVLLTEFIKMLEHQEGSRTGEDIEDVHDMRVAIRRMRSAFRLLNDYFKPDSVDPYTRRLRKIGGTLGVIRDLDVLITDLTKFGGKHEAIQPIITALDERRREAREDYAELVDGKAYRQFVKDFSHFLTTQGVGAKSLGDNKATPHEVRHILPVIIHTHLAAVRVYDDLVENADAATLHALRVEFKRLRYTVSFFKDILGSSIESFVKELKAIQDCLGRLNDISVARVHLEDVLEDSLDEAQTAAIEPYFVALESEVANTRAQFTEIWTQFNTRGVQKKVSDALLVLR